MKTLNDKVKALLGFASKSGSLCYGFSDVTQALKKGKVNGVFFACDVSEKSRKEILFYSQKYGVKAYELKGIDMSTLGGAVGRKCSVVGLNNDSFYDPLISNLTSEF